MPYVIVVNKRGNLPETEPKAAVDIAQAREMAEAEVEVSMNAFGEDREALDSYGWIAASEAAAALPVTGGVIALPDGYVIDVNTISWQALAKLTGYDNRLRSARGPRRREVQESILDAYNVGAP